MSAEIQDPRARLDQLQESLATRQSTTHFAHTFVSTIAALLLGGAAGKLFYDSLRTPLLAWAITAVSVGLLVHAFRRYRRGRQVLAEELKRYETMLELRRQLRLDDPSALLPK
jgi:uncharacterized membrane protein